MNSRFTRNLRSLGGSFRVNIPPDKDGYTGRECPNKECLSYFKVTFGTGLPNATSCVCPYCGTRDDQDHFWTQQQIDYASSVAERQVIDAMNKDLKSMEFSIKPRGSFGIGFSLKVKTARLPTLKRYSEVDLETHVLCDRCTLKYAIYGVFGFCPDCGSHNSITILEANFALIDRMIAMAAGQDQDVAEKLVENALEDCVSAFDGWGRATVKAYASKSSDPGASVSFQNLLKAQARIHKLFGYDLAVGLAPADFDAAVRLLQKRHVFAHQMGVVDQGYIDSTGDHAVPVGRKLRCGPGEVAGTSAVLLTMARGFVAHLESLP